MFPRPSHAVWSAPASGKVQAWVWENMSCKKLSREKEFGLDSIRNSKSELVPWQNFRVSSVSVFAPLILLKVCVCILCVGEMEQLADCRMYPARSVSVSLLIGKCCVCSNSLYHLLAVYYLWQVIQPLLATLSSFVKLC